MDVLSQQRIYITSLQVSSGGKVDKLVFTTNLNKVYVFGGSGGDWTSVDFGNIGLQMHGIYGKSGKKVDQIPCLNKTFINIESTLISNLFRQSIL